MPKGRVLSPVGHVPTRKGKVQPQVGKLLMPRVAIQTLLGLILTQKANLQTLLQQISMPKDFRLHPVDLRHMPKAIQLWHKVIVLMRKDPLQ
ncbi:hypothetical protein BKC07_09065 [Peribacillus simplex]|nr:hypothetical protein BKC07_09065 [Peribacillus simplex]